MSIEEKLSRHKIFETHELISMVKGVHASFEMFNHPLIKDKFRYSDQYGVFDWNSDAFDNLTNEQLYKIYLMCKS